MSSRYQDRDREEGRYSREEPDRRERGEDRRKRYEAEETYRSPRRDDRRGGEREREREREREGDRARSRSPKREPGTSRYEGAGRDDRRPRGPNNDPNYRAPRTDYPPSRESDAGRGRGGGYGGRGGYQRGGYGGGGRGGYHQQNQHQYQQQPEYDRPLDRRAIQEGRRRREEERALGISHDKQEGGEEGSYPEVKVEEGEDGEEEEEDPMAAMMGFGGFGTTKNKSTGQYEGNTSNVHTQRTWRQYMNRRGGFNRALDKVSK